MRLPPLVIGSVLLAVVSCAGLPSAEPTLSSLPAVVDPTVTGTVDVFVTFYGGIDNDPPGSDEIAHPNGRHPAAGGTGTFADPITLATDPDELPIGTVVYHPGLKKYFVMEDECDTCIEEWRAERRPHIDLWVSPADDERVLACEDALTPERPVPVEINPPTGRPVDPRPLYDTDEGCAPPG